MSSRTFRIPTMDCAAEESEIRRALDPVPGIDSLGFQLGPRTIEITAAPEVIEQALEAIRGVGFAPESVEAIAASGSAGALQAPFLGLGRASFRLMVALALAVSAEAVGYFGSKGVITSGLELVLALAAIGMAGIDVYRKGLSALLRARLNINALMTVAVTGAFVIGQWPEAAMVMALYAIAELIEARAVDRARNAIKTLVALAPEEADVKQDDGTWRTTPATDVGIDAVVRIRPGARIPLDGTVATGSSAVNQAPVTGESIPVDKTIGDSVFAGTINETAELDIRVTSTASNSLLARIIHSVEQAQGSRATTQRFVDRFAAVYTPSVFLLAVTVAIGLPLLTAATVLEAVYKALVLLVVACPCALVISTPVTVVSALAQAARRGILIKGGVYLEEARRIRVIALDKTGTITEGRPRLIEHGSLDPDAGEASYTALATSLASRSDHPVSRAIAEGLGKRGPEVADFRALPGRGIQGRMDGQTFVLGNHRLIEEMGLCGQELEKRLKVHEDAGRTVTLLASRRTVIAIFAVADAIKSSSREAIAELRKQGIGTVMLTGDNVATAQAIAEQAGVDEVQGNLLPEDKLTAIQALKARFGFTAMTGDGINDAPALAMADIGIAMGVAGTDTAIEAADIVVMNDNLLRIPETIQLSRKTHAILWQNISIALGIKAIFLVLTLTSGATMWMAVFADMGASLIVVANGLRLLQKGPYKSGG
ncbi:MAG: heavy metal translocating P-type ATPase [Pseudomonadota bacterium]